MQRDRHARFQRARDDNELRKHQRITNRYEYTNVNVLSESTNTKLKVFKGIENWVIRNLIEIKN